MKLIYLLAIWAGAAYLVYYSMFHTGALPQLIGAFVLVFVILPLLQYRAIRAALRGRLLNGLITDEATAGAILKP